MPNINRARSLCGVVPSMVMFFFVCVRKQAPAAAAAWLSPEGGQAVRGPAGAAPTARFWAARTTGRLLGRGMVGRTLTICWWCSRETTAKLWRNGITCGRYVHIHMYVKRAYKDFYGERVDGRCRIRSQVHACKIPSSGRTRS